MTVKSMSMPAAELAVDFALSAAKEKGSPTARHAKEVQQRQVIVRLTTTQTDVGNLLTANQNEIKRLLEGCEDFVGIVAGTNGSPEILTSPNLKQHQFAILGDAYGNFVHHVGGDRSPVGPATTDFRGPKGPKAAAIADGRSSSGSISYPFQRVPKRHRTKTSSRKAGLTPGARKLTQPGSGRLERRARLMLGAPASQIRVDDREKLEQWTKQAILTLQQVACRLVAKIWIKLIHPKKQSTHPYNGGIPRGEPADPNRTRPPYWPIDVIHREPDHIGRDDRTKLLLHLLMNTPQPVITNPPDPNNVKLVTARDLLESLEVKRDELRQDRWEIIQQITRARSMMERFEAGEIDGDTVVFLNDFSEEAPPTPNDSDGESEGAPRLSIPTAGSFDRDAGGHAGSTPTTSIHISPADMLPRDTLLPARQGCHTDNGMATVGQGLGTYRPRSTMHGCREVCPLSTPTGPVRGPGKNPVPRAYRTAHNYPQANGRNDFAMQDCRTAPALAAAPDGRVGESAAVTIPQLLSSTRFDSDHDRKLASRSLAQSQTLSTLERQHQHYNMGLQPWLGVLPDMGPEPPDHFFGVHPQMATQPEVLGGPYLGAHVSEMDAGLQPVGFLSGAAYADFDEEKHHVPVRIMGPAYADFDEEKHHVPVRIMGPGQPGLIRECDMNMDITPTAYYSMP